MNDYNHPLVAVPRRYLVVDGDIEVTNCIATLLRMSGNSVANADTGEAALALAPSFDPQAVLLDLAMPTLDAYETCRLLREQDGGASRWILALTAPGTADEVHEARQSGFDAHFGKPVGLQNLISCLERHLATNNRERA